MDNSKLRKFAQFARRSLIQQVTAKLKQVLVTDSVARRESKEGVRKLEEQIKLYGEKELIERVAYLWFNRFCALRFMDVNGYSRIGVVSPAIGQFQPEILAEAKMGHLDEEMVSAQKQKQIAGLLSGAVSSEEPQAEAYRLLVIAVCNSYSRIMPYLFEHIADYTELLMPDDLLSGNSILAYTREAMTPDVCEDVEVLGWLYQYYISEKKDEVFAALKKRKKITAENIPAATQLFTPHWIVRYLVENSLGRLWLLNRPSSRLAERMDYYIAPEEPEADFLRVSSPEELRLCDPAVGSGHMLTYAFDLLYAIYEEEGYPASDIPRLILEKNLYGIEIDERAGALAAFALVMKARARDRRFFRRLVQPHICVLENVAFGKAELDAYMDAVGEDLFTADLRATLEQFTDAKNVGSLIRPALRDGASIRETLEQKQVGQNLFLQQTDEKVLRVLRQADYLSPKYHVVVANPPYMGGKGMNAQLKSFLKKHYKDYKSDLFSAFIVRIMDLTKPGGFIGMMTPFNWMFLSSFEKLRDKILDENTLTSLVRPEFHALFDSAYVTVCGFTLYSKQLADFRGAFIDLDNFYGAAVQPEKALEAINNPNCGWFYRASAADFKKIPGSPIAYWVSDQVRRVFEEAPSLSTLAAPKQGLITGDNDRFLKYWQEVSASKAAFEHSGDQKWYPINKGGEYRKWYGNRDFVVNWENDGREIKNFKDDNGKLRSRPQNLEYNFSEHISWSLITSGNFSARYYDSSFSFNVAGISCFPTGDKLYLLLCFLNTKIANYLSKIINPTMNSNVSDVGSMPIIEGKGVFNLAKSCREISRRDWDAYETSWDFTRLPLLQDEHRRETLAATYAALREQWHDMTQEMQRLEEENNRLFIDAYGLQDELTPDVPLAEITLTCNPHYRYDDKKSDEELEALLRADTMREFISYGVGCMFGRYSLDTPGLVLANQGDTLDDYLAQVPNPTFPPDADNVIPLLDGDWFPDDITERFKRFLRTTFGEAHYEDNLAFLEDALGRDLRSYFLREFYDDHLKRYKKRPIYWLFSSPGGSFNALIYLHRYRPDTVSVVLNDYLREFRTKLTAHKNHLEQVSISQGSSAREKTRALKEIDQIEKTLTELTAYEDDILYPLATHQLEIDLDDGVKANYPKFGAALKKVAGLS